MKLVPWLAVVLLSVTTHPSNAAERKTKVAISIDAEEYLKPQIQSFLSRELRELRDVTIVEHSESSDWILIVNATVVSNSTSVAIATDYIQTANTEMAAWWPKLSACLSRNDTEAAWNFLAGLSRPRRANLIAGPSENLKEYCREIVAFLDARYLEPERRKRFEQHGQLR